jgi:peptidoglycan/xylan/chitin deacetylase (PgdA/CDA1 family)
VGGALAFGVLCLGFYFKRTIGLRNALSFDYWSTRFHGHEFYNPDKRYFNRGSRDYKDVLLTIDDAPHARSMGLILKTLKDENVHALFFVIGKNVKAAPELTKRILDEGHEIGNHTQDHLRLTTLNEKQIRNEILNCQTNVERATGHTMTFLRPPGMEFNATVTKIVKQYGYILVGWSLGAKDFIPSLKDGSYDIEQIRAMTVSPEVITQRVLKQVQSGSIILLHDNPVTAQALKSTIDQLKAEGYNFVSATQMLAKLQPPVIVEANPPAPKQRS